MDRIFKCNTNVFVFAEVSDMISIRPASIVTNITQQKILNDNFSKVEIRQLIQTIATDSNYFTEIPNPIFSTIEVIELINWYREDSMFPDPEQIAQAIEYWIEYQKPKLNLFLKPYND